MAKRIRCFWAGDNRKMQRYHDDEWGRAEYDSRVLWEKLILDGFQAGLSWAVILKKRTAFRKAFKRFDPKKVARFNMQDVARLLKDRNIIRSRSKIEAAIGNAKAYLAMQRVGEDFSEFIWGMAGGKPIRNTTNRIPTQTALSEDISKELQKRGFKFIGPVIVYAWMQAVGIVNDHDATCFRSTNTGKM